MRTYDAKLALTMALAPVFSSFSSVSTTEIALCYCSMRLQQLPYTFSISVKLSSAIGG